MLVCHCFRITDREIAREAARGANSLGDLSRSCQAGQGCGGCVAMIERILAGAPGESAPDEGGVTEPAASELVAVRGEDSVEAASSGRLPRRLRRVFRRSPSKAEPNPAAPRVSPSRIAVRPCERRDTA